MSKPNPDVAPWTDEPPVTDAPVITADPMKVVVRHLATAPDGLKVLALERA